MQGFNIQENISTIVPWKLKYCGYIKHFPGLETTAMDMGPGRGGLVGQPGGVHRRFKPTEFKKWHVTDKLAHRESFYRI